MWGFEFLLSGGNRSYKKDWEKGMGDSMTWKVFETWMFWCYTYNSGIHCSIFLYFFLRKWGRIWKIIYKDVLKKPILHAFLFLSCPGTKRPLGNSGVRGSCWTIGGWKDIHGSLTVLYILQSCPLIIFTKADPCIQGIAGTLIWVAWIYPIQKHKAIYILYVLPRN